MLADLQLLKIPPLVPGEPLRLDGERTFLTSSCPTSKVRMHAPGRRKRTQSAQECLPEFKQLQLPFGDKKRQTHSVRLSGRGLEALKHALQHLDLWGLRFGDSGLALEGLGGCAFLHRDLFHAYCSLGPADEFLETRFDLLFGVAAGTGNELALDLDWDARQLVCGESVVCKLPVQVSARAPADLVLGPALGRVLTRSVLEFLRMCVPFSVRNVWLRFGGGRVQALARPDVCVVEHVLEPETQEDRAIEIDIEAETEIELPLFPVFDKARSVEFFGRPGDFQLRFGFGVDSFLLHLFR